MIISEILRAAAARVRQGWCRGLLYGPDGSVCARGAIWAVQKEMRLEAEMVVCRALHLPLSLAIWNDQPGRTQEEVARGLEQAADWWEAEQALGIALGPEQ